MKKPVSIKIALFFLLVIAVSAQLLLLVGCANIVPPEGGSRDSLPPNLTKSNPPNGTKNFTGNRIVLSFDEYVDVDNYQQNMIISPLPQNFPTVNRNLNTVTIKIRDTLEENTTYALNFGKTIKDINEGNVMNGFTYLFSTGPYIDSLEFTGRVLQAQTGEPDSTMTIMLRTDQDDSAVIKKRPRYIAKTDGRGSFHFMNLSPGSFYVYALKDEGGSYRYLDRKQPFAFANDPVKVGSQTDTVTLYSYIAAQPEETAPAAPPVAANRNAKPGDRRLKFQTNLKSSKQDLLTKFMFTFETPLRVFDSTKLHFSSDTLFTPVTGYSWTMDSLKKNVTLNYTWKENTLYNLIMEKDFATDTLGQQLLKSDTFSFNTRNASEYGKISLRFRNLDLSKNPVLILVLGNEEKGLYPLTSESFSLPMFEPGEYNLRILNDANKNGKWDPGEFFGKHKQPEIVKPVSRKINVRPNWDDTIEIAL
jgi:uncharacterized protein (DUF2141 family)